MPRKERSFSDQDAIRFIERNLTQAERERVLAHFGLTQSVFGQEELSSLSASVERLYGPLGILSRVEIALAQLSAVLQFVQESILNDLVDLRQQIQDLKAAIESLPELVQPFLSPVSLLIDVIERATQPVQVIGDVLSAVNALQSEILVEQTESASWRTAIENLQE